MSSAHDGARHPFARDVLWHLSQGSGALIALSFAQFEDAAAQALHLAGNNALATELVATARLLHGLRAYDARDQVLVLAAIILEDRALNAALCRRLHGRMANAAKLLGDSPVATTTVRHDPAKSALAVRLAAKLCD